MSTLYEGNTLGDVVLYQEPNYSPGAVTVGTAADLEPGTVLGKITATGKYIRSVRTATDGSENAVAVLTRQADAAAADVASVALLRHARVRRGGLVFDASYSTEAFRDAAIASLAGAGIVAE
ncbi:MAG: head decoration protein [Rhodobacteraceae bacterium]|nr:head decoration protein [Paracoccaceae bacterium]